MYGGAPPHWLAGDGPKRAWLPSGKPAWSLLWPPENIIPFPIPPAVAEAVRAAADRHQTPARVEIVQYIVEGRRRRARVGGSPPLPSSLLAQALPHHAISKRADCCQAANSCGASRRMPRTTLDPQAPSRLLRLQGLENSRYRQRTRLNRWPDQRFPSRHGGERVNHPPPFYGCSTPPITKRKTIRTSMTTLDKMCSAIRPVASCDRRSRTITVEGLGQGNCSPS